MKISQDPAKKNQKKKQAPRILAHNSEPATQLLPERFLFNHRHPSNFIATRKVGKNAEELLTQLKKTYFDVMHLCSNIIRRKEQVGGNLLRPKRTASSSGVAFEHIRH